MFYYFLFYDRMKIYRKNTEDGGYEKGKKHSAGAKTSKNKSKNDVCYFVSGSFIYC